MTPHHWFNLTVFESSPKTQLFGKMKSQYCCLFSESRHLFIRIAICISSGRTTWLRSAYFAGRFLFSRL